MTEQTPGQTNEPVVERFDATGGRLWGLVGLAIVAAVTVVWLVEGERPRLPVASGALLLGALMWAALLRPRVWVTETDVVLRGMFDTVHVPLAAIEEVVVGQVLAVRAGERRFVSPAVGRSRRGSARRASTGTAGGVAGVTGGIAGVAASAALPGSAPPAHEHAGGSYADFVQSRLRQHAERARADIGIRAGAAEQAALLAEVRRERAWSHVAVLAALAVVFVVALLL